MVCEKVLSYYTMITTCRKKENVINCIYFYNNILKKNLDAHLEDNRNQHLLLS